MSHMGGTTDHVDETVVRDQIRAYIAENFLLNVDPATLQNDTSLVEHGIVDSTGFLEVVLFIEEAYGITIEQDDLQPENLDSVNNLTRYVTRRLAVA